MSKADVAVAVPVEAQISIAVKPVLAMVAHSLKQHSGDLAMQVVIAQMITERVSHVADQLTQLLKEEKGESGKAEFIEIVRVLTQDTQEAQQ